MTAIAAQTLKDMQAEVFEVNKALGWYDKPVSFPEAMALVHSEISEALEAYRKHGFTPWTGDQLLDLLHPDYQGQKPEGVGSEFADILIRLLDYVQRFGFNLEDALDRYPVHGRPHPDDTEDFGANICRLHDLTSLAFGRYEIGRTPDVQVAAIYAFLVRLCEHYGIDLAHEYQSKLAFNRTRSYRHGGKRM